MAKERKVTYILEVVAGGGNKKTVDEAIAGIKAVTAATKEQSAAAKEAARVNEAAERATKAKRSRGTFDDGMMAGARRAAEAERRERELNLSNMVRLAAEEKRILSERVRANIAANREISEAARRAVAEGWQRRQERERNWGATQAARAAGNDGFGDTDAKRAVGEIGRQRAAESRVAEAAAKSQIAAAKRIQAENLKVLSGYSQIAGGILSTARAAIFLAGANEESAQKMLKMVMYAEALASAFSGARGVIGGLAKVGGSAAAGGMGRSLVGGAAGGAVGGAAAGGGGAAAGLFSPFASVGLVGSLGAAAGVAAVGAGADAFRSWRRGESVTGNWREDWENLTGDPVGDNARRWQAAFARVGARRGEFANRMGIDADRNSQIGGINAEMARLQAMAGYGGTDANGAKRSGAAAALAASGQTLAAAESMRVNAFRSSDSSPEAQATALQAVKEALEEQKRLKLEMLEIDREANREAIQASERKIQALKAEQSRMLSLYGDAVEQKRAGAAAWLGMTPGQRAQVQAGIDTAQRTGSLQDIPEEQLALMEQVGGIGSSIASVAREKKANDLGFSKPGGVGEFLFGNPGQIAKQAIEMNAKIVNETQVKVSLEVNEREWAAKIVEALKPTSEQIKQVLEGLADVRNRQALMERQQQLRDGTSGG